MWIARTTGPRTLRLLLLAAALTLAAGGVSVEPVAAQSGVTADCRCVDAAGEPIDGCVCVQSPVRGDLWADLPFARRAVVGISIDYAQGPEVDAQGAEMLEVLDDGPADRAGMRAGDIVTHVDGRSVFDPLDPARERGLSEAESLPVQRFVQRIGALEPGEPVEIRYLRDGAAHTATVTPERATAAPLDMWGDAVRLRLRDGLAMTVRPADREGRPFVVQSIPGDQLCGKLRGDGDGGRSIRLFGVTNCVAGIEFVELTPGLGEYFGTERGVLVADVADGSTLGLRPGDVVMAIDGRAVDSVDTVRRILRSYLADEEVRLRVMRRGSESEVLGRIP